jgi:dolichyl-phosphate beta-glucosyltransferase
MESLASEIGRLRAERSISIVIPAYNEANRLPETLYRVITYLNARRFLLAEVIVSDDGSQDATVAIANVFSACWPCIRTLR